MKEVATFLVSGLLVAASFAARGQSPTPSSPLTKPPPGFTDDTCGQRYYCMLEPVRAKRLVDKQLGVCSSYVKDTENVKPAVVCTETSCRLTDNEVPFQFKIDLKCKLPSSTTNMTPAQFADFMTQYKKDHALSYSVDNCDKHSKAFLEYINGKTPPTVAGGLEPSEIDKARKAAKTALQFRARIWMATYKPAPSASSGSSGFNFYQCMGGKKVMNVYACPNIVPLTVRTAEGTDDHADHLRHCNVKGYEALLDTFRRDGDSIDLKKLNDPPAESYTEWQKFADANYFGKPDLQTFADTFASVKALRDPAFCPAPDDTAKEAANTKQFDDLEQRFNDTYGSATQAEPRLLLPCRKCPQRGGN